MERLELTWLPSVEDVARETDVVLLSLPHPDISRAVVELIVRSDSPPRIVVETSTVTPRLARSLGERCAEAGIGFVDAAIAGGVQLMARGRNTFLVGGSPEDFELARPVLDSIAERIHHLGPVGAGSGLKVVNNAVMHAVMVVLLEAAAMGGRLGISLEDLIEILSRPDGLLRPLEHRLGERVREGRFEGGMSVRNARKDSTLALETAQDLGVPLFAILASHTPYEIGERTGLGELDYAALVKLWEAWCGPIAGREGVEGGG